MHMRIQWAAYGVLVAEVIVEYHMVDKTLAAFGTAKYNKHGESPGSLTYRADMPRYWDGKVGEEIGEAQRR